jgi:hypothetical protein
VANAQYRMKRENPVLKKIKIKKSLLILKKRKKKGR